MGTGATLSSVRRNMEQGSLRVTNNPFDLTIEGDGFFAVQSPNQRIYYTRDGSFGSNSSGAITNSIGYKIMPNMILPSNTRSVNISRDGKVFVYLEGQETGTIIGQIQVFTFNNPVGLKAKGGNLFQATNASGVANANIAGEGKAGAIRQGALESSNVKIMTEMTDLIRAQRAYEMNAKVMRTTDEMLQTLNNIR